MWLNFQYSNMTVLLLARKFEYFLLNKLQYKKPKWYLILCDKGRLN